MDLFENRLSPYFFMLLALSNFDHRYKYLYIKLVYIYIITLIILRM